MSVYALTAAAWMKSTEAERKECPCCGELSHTVETRRISTQYVDDSLNYTTTCESCFFEQELHWKELWREYYGGFL